jgi:hypothetical protein
MFGVSASVEVAVLARAAAGGAAPARAAARGRRQHGCSAHSDRHLCGGPRPGLGYLSVTVKLLSLSAGLDVAATTVPLLLVRL